MLNSLWPWALLVFAAVVFIVKFTVGYMLATMYTETIVLPVFFHDIIVEHHSAADWAWGGFSALFPDILLYFGINSLVPDGMLALQLLHISFFIAWMAATVALVLELRRPHKLSLLALLLLLWIGLVSDFGIPRDHGLFIDRSLLMPIYHSGTGIMTAICLVLLLRQISLGWSIGFSWLMVLSFLGSASDTLFDAVFVIPALVVLLLLALVFREGWKWHLTLAGSLSVSSVAAYFLAPHLFPPALATDDYLRFDWDRTEDALTAITREVSQPEHHLFALAMILDVVTVLGGLGGLLFFCFSSRRKVISIVVFSLMIFCSCSVLANWAAVIATGNYIDINANRYTTFALFIPPFVLAFTLHAIVPWWTSLEKVFALAVAAFTLYVAFIPQNPSMQYGGIRTDLPFLKKVMKANDIHACLGSYWCANITTFLSHGEVPVRSLTNDSKIYRWFNSLEWFGKGHPAQDWPQFRLIYGPDPGYADTFGQPDEILTAPSGAVVWVYSKSRSIFYDEYFDVLSNNLSDQGRTLHLRSATQPGDSEIDGSARVAKDGGAEGSLEFGPFCVLMPGRYRATYHYAFSMLPRPDHAITYDMLVRSRNKVEELHGQPLPSPNTEPQAFTDNFTVTEPGCSYEMRLFFHGSGTIRVEGLDLTFLGN